MVEGGKITVMSVSLVWISGMSSFLPLVLFFHLRYLVLVVVVLCFFNLIFPFSISRLTYLFHRASLEQLHLILIFPFFEVLDHVKSLAYVLLYFWVFLAGVFFLGLNSF